MTPNEITITAENLEEIKEQMPRDQAAELVVGCRTWGIFYSGSCRGQMTVWPNEGYNSARGAVEFGGDSIWGDWYESDKLLYTEDNDEAGNLIAYTETGEGIAITTDGERVDVAR